MEVGLVPVIPVVFAFFLPVIAWRVNSKKFINLYALTATGIVLALSLKLFNLAYSSDRPAVYAFGNWPAPIGIVFEVDRLSSLLVLTTAFLFFMAVVYSIDYMKGERGVQYYYTALLGLEAGILGAFMTGDAFNLFVMLEVLGASAYALVAFYRSRGESVEAAFKYALVGATGTSFYFLAMGLVYSSFGTLNMADISAKFHGIKFPITGGPIGNVEGTVAVFFALAVFAFTIKSANFPGHFWLPDAHPAAPSPVSALLSGLVVAVGIYSMARFVYTVFYPIPEWISTVLSAVLIFLGTASAILGSLMMLRQDDLKRMIAYSTIMHMGYLFMGVGVISTLGLAAVTYHIINHALGKALLFLSAGSFIHASGTRSIRDMAGIGKSMPITLSAFIISTLALVGVPPLSTFFSKMLLYDAVIVANPVLGAVIILTSAVAGWAYFRAMVYIWRGKPSKGHHHEENHPSIHGHEMPFMAIVLAILSIAVVVVGVLSPTIIDRYILPSAHQAMDYNAYIEAVRRLSVSILST